MDDGLVSQLRRAIERDLDRSLTDLGRLVAQPSISSQNEGMDQAAALVVDLLGEYGIDAKPMETGGYAAVVGSIAGSGERTIVLYNHYDVQPAEPLDLWDSPPFEMTHRDGRLIGRGVADDKGHIICRLAALEAVRSVLGELPWATTFVIEGEEEISSPHLPQFIADHRDLLAADACIWETGGVGYGGQPQIMLGMRGICYLEYTVRTMSRDAHSGSAHVLPNAAWRLVRALNSIQAADGEILVEGFYDDARQPTAEELQLLAALPDTAPDLRVDYGLESLAYGLDGLEALRAVYRPTANIAGFSSGYEGPGPKTVIPATALAKMDFRLVPDQDPADIVRKVRSHLDRAGFPDVEVRFLGGEPAATTPVSEPWVQLAIETATEAYGMEPAIVPLIGGSGPMHAFRESLGVPIVTAGLGHPESLIHAPNENILIENLRVGTLHTALLLARAGELPAAT